MLIELWERLRGYHKWTETEAKIEFVKEEHTYRDTSGKGLVWLNLVIHNK